MAVRFAVPPQPVEPPTRGPTAPTPQAQANQIAGAGKNRKLDSGILPRIERVRSHLVRTERGTSHELFAKKARSEHTYIRVHQAHHMLTETWQALTSHEQNLARSLSVHSIARSPTVFSHHSAAVLHGLPLFHRPDPRTHVTLTIEQCGRRTRALVRHRVSNLRTDDVVSVAKVFFTSVERTVLDLAQSGDVEDALCVADAYLRRRFRHGHRVDQAGVDAWRAHMQGRLHKLKGARGVRAMREVISLADPRKDSVLESVSHLRLTRLGFDVELQLPVPGPVGQTYYVDFRLRSLGVLCEVDGRSKYTDPELLAGRSVQQVVYEEKRRQDWICQTRSERMIRWGFPEIRSELDLASHLRAAGLDIPHHPNGLRF